jgi:hypothetical protein
MTRRRLVLHASSLRFALEFEGAARAERALEAAWGATARRCFVPARREVTYAVERAARGHVLRHPAGEVASAHEDELTPRLEWLMYHELFEQHRADGSCLVHASCAVADGRAIVFAGASGAGKSALVRAAVEAGLGYLGDEHVVSDGRAIWGVPRAIHLDGHRAGEPAPPWHEGADVESYRTRQPDEGVRCTPLVHVPLERVPEAPLPLSTAVLVAPRRGTRDHVAPLSAAARLNCLREASLVASDALATLAEGSTALALEWRDPATALARVLDALGGGA